MAAAVPAGRKPTAAETVPEGTVTPETTVAPEGTVTPMGTAALMGRMRMAAVMQEIIPMQIRAMKAGI